MMNDKIFNIGRVATQWCCTNLNLDTPKEEWDAAWEQKFAELIVLACVERIKRVGILEDIEIESNMIADSVLEHFGVEE